jgi:hypothetical protein
MSCGRDSVKPKHGISPSSKVSKPTDSSLESALAILPRKDSKPSRGFCGFVISYPKVLIY